MSKLLMPWAEQAHAYFYDAYGTGNCSCHISAPCGSCTHEGNMCNLENDPYAWGEVHEVMAIEAQDDLKRFIASRAKDHVNEMKAQWAEWAGS